MVTDKQVQLLGLKMKEDKTIEAAAAAADMSARRRTNGSRARCRPRPRSRGIGGPAWIHSPVWEAEVVPLLERDDAGVLDATTVLEDLAKRHGGRFDECHLRTLQRRIRDWRVLHG